MPLGACRKHRGTVRPHAAPGHRMPAPKMVACRAAGYDGRYPAPLRLPPAVARQAAMPQRLDQTTRWAPVDRMTFAARSRTSAESPRTASQRQGALPRDDPIRRASRKARSTWARAARSSGDKARSKIVPISLQCQWTAMRRVERPGETPWADSPIGAATGSDRDHPGGSAASIKANAASARMASQAATISSVRRPGPARQFRVPRTSPDTTIGTLTIDSSPRSRIFS